MLGPQNLHKFIRKKRKERIIQRQRPAASPSRPQNDEISSDIPFGHLNIFIQANYYAQMQRAAVQYVA